jgi:DNA gyrase subunit A
MAKKEDIPKEAEIATDKIVDRSIATEMRESFLDYAMSVITERALPDVRDGLKPVHRRILFSMNENGLSFSSKPRKSATVVGDVLGNYHPHGDSSVYEALVKMAQPFSYRMPLVIGQGNFGSIDGDAAAAYRYTEAKMSKISSELLHDIDKDTVDFQPNYDGRKKEPVVLPTAYPNLLVNGTLGIAVAMATNIPPHNLREIIDATVHLIDTPKATTDDLLEHVQGPDFPTGGIAFNKKDMAHAYATGKGGVVTRGHAEVTESKSGSFQIIITSIPYRVNKSNLIIKIADLVREKKIEGIRDIRDESTDDIRVVIDLKGGSHPQKILNMLYKHTQLEETFHFNLVALVGGVPQLLSLKGILEEFIKHRVEVVIRRTQFDLNKALDREHILLGLKKALDHIDKIIKLIRAAKDVETAHKALRKEFKFSDRQATAILEMRLQKLAGLERKKIEDELESVQELITKLKKLLASKTMIQSLIKKELVEIGEKYGDDRRTQIMARGAKSFSVEDLIPDEDYTLVLTEGGYIKRTKPDEFRKQKRGGVGVVDLNTKDDDIVTKLITTSAHSDLLFFSDRGKVYQVKMYDIPEGRRATRGKSIMNFLPLESEEHVTSVVPMTKDTKANASSIVMVTRQGVVKKVEANSFHDVRRSGLIAIKLASGDSLVTALFTSEKEEVVVTTKLGQSIRFKESDTRHMGRGAAGVRAIKLSGKDQVVAVQIVKVDEKDNFLLVISANGYGKKSPITEYKIQNRGGSGIKTIRLTDKTGELITARMVDHAESEIVVMSEKGQVIRLSVKDIPVLGRQTQGVRVMKLRAGDKVASVVCL